MNDETKVKILYDNSQTWLRHYDTVLFTVNLFIATVVLGYLGMLVRQTQGGISGFYWPADLIIAATNFIFPALMVCIGFWLTHFIDTATRHAWSRVVMCEVSLGLYDLRNASNDKPLLDESFKQSGKSVAGFCKLSYILNVVLLVVTILSFFLIPQA